MNFPNSKGRSILKTTIFRNSPSYFSIIGQDGINTVVIISVEEVEVKRCFRATAVVVPKGLFEKLRCHSDLGIPLFWVPYPRGGGEGGIKNCLYINGEAPPLGPTPYPLIYNFFRKRYPFRTHSVDKCHPFHIPCLELCLPFNSCKCTVF